MKIKIGDLVTAKNWYHPRRVWGRVTMIHKPWKYSRTNEVVVFGGFGLAGFHQSTIKLVAK